MNKKSYEAWVRTEVMLRNIETKTGMKFSVCYKTFYMDHCYIGAVTRIGLNTLVWVSLMSELKYLSG